MKTGAFGASISSPASKTATPTAATTIALRRSSRSGANAVAR
jgi:hypothetical protein